MAKMIKLFNDASEKPGDKSKYDQVYEKMERV